MNLTEDDVLLLAHIAGGFNYNRVGVPYSDRFPASVKWGNADALNKLVEKLTESPPVTPPPVSPDTLYAVADWGGAGRFVTPGPFVNNAFCVQVTVPPGSFPVAGKFALAEYSGEVHLREMTVSRFPNDFRPVDLTGANGPIAGGSGAEAVVTFSVGGGGDAVLTPGVWYVNMKNAPADKDYPALLNITWPHG